MKPMFVYTTGCLSCIQYLWDYLCFSISPVLKCSIYSVIILACISLANYLALANEAFTSLRNGENYPYLTVIINLSWSYGSHDYYLLYTAATLIVYMSWLSFTNLLFSDIKPFLTVTVLTFSASSSSTFAE